MEGVHSNVEPGITKVSPPTSPVGVDLSAAILKDFLGTGSEVSKGRVLLHGNADGVVEEAELLLRLKGNECEKESEPAYWNLRLAFKELRSARAAKISDDVKKLLDAEIAKPAK